MRNIYKILAILFMGLLLESCYYDTFPEDVTPSPEEVSYKDDIQPIWDGACTTCHGNIPPNLEAGSSYNNLINGGYVVAFDADNSTLYHSLLGIEGVSLMPPGTKLPNSQINLVKQWIDEGAENN